MIQEYLNNFLAMTRDICEQGNEIPTPVPLVRRGGGGERVKEGQGKGKTW